MAAKRTLQIFLIAAVLAASVLIRHGVAADGLCGNIYIVQPGDWLIKIADHCAVSLAALYDANPGVAYQPYIYPGQALNIPGGTSFPQPYGTSYPPPTYQVISAYNRPNLLATPHVGNNYYSSRSHVGTQLAYQVTVYNTGNTPLQLTASLDFPTGWYVNASYNNCPGSLGAGGNCTFTWEFTPRVSGYAYLRVYVRGHYTDSYGNSQRVTGSPAFLFDVNP